MIAHYQKLPNSEFKMAFISQYLCFHFHILEFSYPASPLSNHSVHIFVHNPEAIRMKDSSGYPYRQETIQIMLLNGLVTDVEIRLRFYS